MYFERQMKSKRFRDKFHKILLDFVEVSCFYCKSFENLCRVSRKINFCKTFSLCDSKWNRKRKLIDRFSGGKYFSTVERDLDHRLNLELCESLSAFRKYLEEQRDSDDRVEERSKQEWQEISGNPFPMKRKTRWFSFETMFVTDCFSYCFDSSNDISIL